MLSLLSIIVIFIAVVVFAIIISIPVAIDLEERQHLSKNPEEKLLELMRISETKAEN